MTDLSLFPANPFEEAGMTLDEVMACALAWSGHPDDGRRVVVALSQKPLAARKKAVERWRDDHGNGYQGLPA